jgi:hypothetical protein
MARVVVLLAAAAGVYIAPPGLCGTVVLGATCWPAI